MIIVVNTMIANIIIIVITYSPPRLPPSARRRRRARARISSGDLRRRPKKGFRLILQRRRVRRRLVRQPSSRLFEKKHCLLAEHAQLFELIRAGSTLFSSTLYGTCRHNYHQMKTQKLPETTCFQDFGPPAECSDRPRTLDRSFWNLDQVTVRVNMRIAERRRLPRQSRAAESRDPTRVRAHRTQGHSSKRPILQLETARRSCHQHCSCSIHVST